MSLAFAVFFAVMVFTSIAGMPIGISMIVSTTVYLMVTGRDLALAGETVLNGIFTSYAALAVPLFIFASNLMSAGSITRRLLDFSLALVGRWRGGLAQVNIFTSLIFAGMSGSSVADVAGTGRIVTSMMMENGRYTPGYSGAVTAASSIVGTIFPPSIPIVLYALISSTSIGALFMGGVMPALLIVVVLMVIVSVQARLRNFPRDNTVTARELPSVALRALPPLIMPVVLIGGIYSGAFTPTESAAVAGLYAILLSMLYYRDLGLGGLLRTTIDTAKTTAVVTTVIGGAFAFNYVVAVERIPAAIADVFHHYAFSATMFLLVVNVLYLILGCFFSTTTLLLVVTPLFVPAAASLGIDLVHFGVVVVLNLMIGLMTPPYGVLFLLIRSLNGIKIGEMVRESWIFIGALIVILFLITYVPSIVLWLPRTLGMMG